MKIHLVSDLHIEMGPPITPSCASDVVVCAGDIGLIKNLAQLKKYFDKVKETTDNIIYVLGNHEFYHSDYNKALDCANDFANKEGIILMDEALNTESKVIDGVKFWGSTLWTDLKDSDWFVIQKVGQGMNDFFVIHDGDRVFTAHKSIEINERTRKKIDWDADVIITHHSPVVLKHRRFPINDITYGFCNDGLEQQIIDSNIKCWMYGHTHDSRNIDLNKTNLISNQQGYCRQDYHTGGVVYEDCGGFDPGLILEI